VKGITEVAGSGMVLDFDCESRPMSFRGDRPTAEITAIGMSWVGTEDTEVWLLGEDEPRDMLLRFSELYAQADVVTGHYIRGFDLSLINAGLMEYGLPPLGRKMTSDTKQDLIKYRDISAKQEDLLEMLDIPIEKYGHGPSPVAPRQPAAARGTSKRRSSASRVTCVVTN
jgi:hypothetical protein